MPSVAARSNGWHCLDGLGVSEIFYLPDLSIFLFKELFLKQFLFCLIDKLRFSQPARHELRPCYVRPIAARLVYSFLKKLFF